MTHKIILEESDRYSLHKVLTYNAMWNFIIGARGLGKTFDAVRHGIREAIKYGNEFIYLRRTDVEQKSKDTFFANTAPFFKEYNFRVNGVRGEFQKTTEDEKSWHTCCYFVALSQAGGKKSIPYPKVTSIIFDEVFPDNLTFLRNEVTAFEEFYNTVDRYRDETRVFFLANAVVQANPYWSAFKINLDDQKKKQTQIKTYCDGFISVELADYGGFSAKVANSRLGQFLTKYDKDYAEYAIQNKFRDDSNTLLTDMPENAAYGYTLETETYGSFGIWSELIDGTTILIVSRKVKKTQAYPQFTLDYRKVSEHVIFLKRTDTILAKLTRTYRTGSVYFDSAQAKSDFTMVIGDILGK